MVYKGVDQITWTGVNALHDVVSQMGEHAKSRSHINEYVAVNNAMERVRFYHYHPANAA
jgi:hypothetical protein